MKEVFLSEVTTYSRLHLGLHDCGYATMRIFGGVGVAFKGFPTSVQVRPASQLTLTFSKRLHPSQRTLEGVEELRQRLEPQFGTFAVEVVEAAPEHMGFGSKTSLLLAITQAVVEASDRHADISPAEIVQLTGRGGTSGIGVNTFWGGGLVADAGHRAGENRHFAPSSLRTAHEIPPLVSRVAMPVDWQLHLFYDPNFTPVEGALEKRKFSELMPLDELENLRAIATTYHGIIPAVIEHDRARLAEALRTMNQIGMKRHEVAVQTDRTQQFLAQLWEAGLAAGLTSFGPTVFVIDEAKNKRVDTALRIAKQLGLESLGSFAFDNEGVPRHEPALV